MAIINQFLNFISIRAVRGSSFRPSRQHRLSSFFASAPPARNFFFPRACGARCVIQLNTAGRTMWVHPEAESWPALSLCTFGSSHLRSLRRSTTRSGPPDWAWKANKLLFKVCLSHPTVLEAEIDWYCQWHEGSQLKLLVNSSTAPS